MISRLSLNLVLLAAAGLAAPALADPPPTPPPAAASEAPAAPTPGPAGEAPAAPADDSFLSEYYRVHRIPKALVVPAEDGYVRVAPEYLGNQLWEVVGEEGNEVLVRNLPIEDPRSAQHSLWVAAQKRQAAIVEAQKQVVVGYFLDAGDVVPPPFTDRLQFRVVTEGLPRNGSWQVGLDLADMDGDGKLDILLPPARRGDGRPTIILGDGKLGFSRWEALRLPADLSLDYGTARAADFDGDGRLDLALASHFKKVYVLHGDGKGGYERQQELAAATPDMTAKALAVGDFNGDGRPDVAFQAEIDASRRANVRLKGPMVNVMLNRKEGWRPFNEGLPGETFGDHMVAFDMNRDGADDLVVASHRGGTRSIVLLSPGKAGGAWQVAGFDEMPADAFVYGVAAGRVDHRRGADALTCFEQVNEADRAHPIHACVLYHFHSAEGRWQAAPAPQVIFQDTESDYILAAALGDVDGDGRLDLVAGRASGRVRVFLQLAPGQFYEEQSEELQLAGTIFDVAVRDLDGDRRGEIVVMMADKEGKGGGVTVLAPSPRAATAGP